MAQKLAGRAEGASARFGQSEARVAELAAGVRAGRVEAFELSRYLRTAKGGIEIVAGHPELLGTPVFVEDTNTYLAELLAQEPGFAKAFLAPNSMLRKLPIEVSGPALAEAGRTLKG